MGRQLTRPKDPSRTRCCIPGSRIRRSEIDLEPGGDHVAKETSGVGIRDSVLSIATEIGGIPQVRAEARGDGAMEAGGDGVHPIVAHSGRQAGTGVIRIQESRPQVQGEPVRELAPIIEVVVAVQRGYSAQAGDPLKLSEFERECVFGTDLRAESRFTVELDRVMVFDGCDMRRSVSGITAKIRTNLEVELQPFGGSRFDAEEQSLIVAGGAVGVPVELLLELVAVAIAEGESHLRADFPAQVQAAGDVVAVRIILIAFLGSRRAQRGAQVIIEQGSGRAREPGLPVIARPDLGRVLEWLRDRAKVSLR